MGKLEVIIRQICWLASVRIPLSFRALCTLVKHGPYVFKSLSFTDNEWNLTVTLKCFAVTILNIYPLK